MACQEKAKVCFVPMCPNTGHNSDKIFIRVPRNLNIRKVWWEVAKVKSIIYTGGNVYCCEDHFDLEKDSTNWMFYKIMGKKLMLKSDVVPHKNLEIATTTIGSQLTDSERKRKAQRLHRLKSDESVKKVKMVRRPLLLEDQSPSGLFRIEPFSRSVKIQANIEPVLRSVKIQATPNVRTQGTDTQNLAAVVSVGTMTRKRTFSSKVRKT